MPSHKWLFWSALISLAVSVGVTNAAFRCKSGGTLSKILTGGQ